ncbi:hypothetical protein BDD12DRAFT_834179 [Trichophaea hybrida]|nr:hypothetical protein BDD12DRAFT_834179 [Trichophaea hybrida]
MFVPRQVQKSYTAGHPAALPKSSASSKNKSIVVSPGKLKHAVSATTSATTATNITKPGTIDLQTAQAIVLALEQLFSSQNPWTQWLDERRREVDGRNDYIHLAAVIECPYFKDHRPQLSQIIVRRALEGVPSEVLEISADCYHIRLSSDTPRTPLPDANTIYVEPAITNTTTRTPGRLALELQKTLPTELLPVKYTTNDNRSWALLTLSSAVTQEHLEKKNLWPQGWIVLSKKEWEYRDSLYRQRREEALQARLQLHHQHQHQPKHQDRNLIPAPAPKHIFEPGLIVHITHLHPDVNKPGISSFIMRSVDRYIRKREKRSPSSSSAPPPAKIKINYIDYKKDSSSCYLRQSTTEDSHLIIAALKKRKRVMQSGDDRKGRKTKEGFVVGRLLEGLEEVEYWRKMEEMGKEKKVKKGKEREGKVSTVDVRSAGKRPRGNSGSSPEGKGKKKKKFGG